MAPVNTSIEPRVFRLELTGSWAEQTNPVTLYDIPHTVWVMAESEEEARQWAVDITTDDPADKEDLGPNWTDTTIIWTSPEFSEITEFHHGIIHQEWTDERDIS